MDLNTFRCQAGEHDSLAATYWRRRFLALVIGLAILAVIAWALSGVAAGGSAAGTGASTPLAASVGSLGAATPGPGGGTASPGTEAPGNATAAGSAGPGSTTRPAAATRSGGTTRPGGTTGSGGTAARLRACRPGDLVITLYAGRGVYGPRQAPAFDVAFVSTAARPCAVNVGPRFLKLAVTGHGRRVWGLADCAAGHGSLLAGLARGVPEIVPVSWDRQTSAPGCAQEARRAPAGRYAAVASDGGVTSNPVTFRVR